MKSEDKVLLRESCDHQSKDPVDDCKIDFHVFFFFFSSFISFVIFDQFPRQDPAATT